MAKNSFIYLVLIVVVTGGVWLVVRKGKSKTTLEGESPAPSPSVLATPTAGASVPASVTPAPIITMANGLQIQDLVPGTGTQAKTGNTVTVNYIGTFTDGTKFDSSYDHGQPFQFTLGAGRVIKGWDIGVAGMKVGGKRRLVIPPDLAYGTSGAGGVIPPNATLVFEVELLAVQ